ncbi:MAG TPA: hypothetical protein PKD49_02940 [Hyphomicrobium sp.]|nr:hypothetical protein [Hyphomicrobium sp.]
MRKTFLSLTCAAVAALSFSFAEDASAACTRLGFSVNDYGKEGPARDAKQLLDKYIAKWAGENGIAKYTTGKKDVTCELFLDFIVFDEYTCRAEASVCWEGAPVKSAAQSSELDANAAPAAKPKPAKAAAAKTPSHVETGSVDKSPAPEAGQEAGQEAGGDAGAGEGNDQATP